MPESLLQLRLDGIVIGRAGVIAIRSNVKEARIALQELGIGNGLAADRTERRELSVEGICRSCEQRRSLGQLRGGELVQVGIRDADMDDVRADIGDVEAEIASDRALDGQVPLLCATGARLAIEAIDALAEAGV